MDTLVDSHGRRFSYLRLSITERCNYRCAYCLPNGCGAFDGSASELSLAEIRRLVAAFAELGFSKVRLTGGEPSLRRDFLDIIKCISSTEGIDHLGLTTNGHGLRRFAQEIKKAGVSSLNISVDSLDSERFFQITGSKHFADTLEGVEEALALGFRSIKINTVLMQGLNSDDIGFFLKWVKDKPLALRFIELMETADNKEFFSKHYLPAEVLKEALLAGGWTLKPKVRANGGAAKLSHAGPAVDYVHEDFLGSVGIIAPYSKDFCASCNRLRVDSRGRLRLCLFGDSPLPLRHLLQEDSNKKVLKDLVRKSLAAKPPSHHLTESDYGATSNLAVIGG